ncbi:MAG TPA: protein-methionine-sulfoxide reductase heme-binding subunit MsrQ [Candidatus Baltobacteraceae bacterium]|nr:protein-methionine-sulfoxide reductase heme-binding subunit MsrQ [Candidatus Baltobacteraceae bacterium]
MNAIWTSKWTKVVVFILCLVPLGLLIWRAVQGDLTANPINYIEHRTGDWTLRFLVITLAITPLRKLVRQPQLIRFRRMFGLYAFFYGCLHFSSWFGLDLFFDLHDIGKEIAKRPFITVGFAAFVLMIPLALTSTAASIRRLGGKRWRMLHRLIYISAIGGVIHYYWLVKSDKHKPLEYGFLVALLLAWRLGVWLIDRFRPAPAAAHDAPRTTPESA